MPDRYSDPIAAVTAVRLYDAMIEAVALMLAAGPISKWDERAPDLSYASSAPIYEIERCLIDMPNAVAPSVYRQPDRPGEVTLVWPNQFGNSIGRVTLSGSDTRTAVRSWRVRGESVLSCAPRSSQE